ncbi:MAG: ExbD/TolR family protein [Aureliella sp.]
MPLRANTSEELPSVNLTPMIDVVFLLIIFFMVGTQFTESEKQIELALPSAGQLNSLVTPPPQREVAIGADGSLALDGRNVTLEELAQRLAAMRQVYPDIGVVVRADGTVQHQTVTAVYGEIIRAGVSKTSVAVRSQPVSFR